MVEDAVIDLYLERQLAVLKKPGGISVEVVERDGVWHNPLKSELVPIVRDYWKDCCNTIFNTTFNTNVNQIYAEQITINITKTEVRTDWSYAATLVDSSLF